MISVGPGLYVDPSSVSSIKREHRDYMNGSANYLIITMNNGEVFRLEHGYGVDIFAIEKALVEAEGG